eukprot:s3919_g3.t1
MYDASLRRTAKLLTREDGHVVRWSFSHEDAAPTAPSSTPAAPWVAPPAAAVATATHAPPSFGGAYVAAAPWTAAPHVAVSDNQDAAAAAYAPCAGGDVPARAPICGAKKDAVGLMEQLRNLDLDDRKAAAEATRADLVKIWKDKAKPDKKGRAYRGIIGYDCMPGIPALLEAQPGKGKKTL